MRNNKVLSVVLFVLSICTAITSNIMLKICSEMWRKGE